MLDPSHLYPRSSSYAKPQKSELIRETIRAIMHDFVWPFVVAFVFGLIVVAAIAEGAR